MIRRTLTVVIGCALMITLGTMSLVAAKPKGDKQREATEKVKAGILSLGVGPETNVEVTLRDKTKLTGYISEANEESFVVSDSKSGTRTTVPYPQVAKVKGNNWSSKKTIAVTAVIVGALAIIYFAFFHGKHL
jgi:hypothetical protein